MENEEREPSIFDVDGALTAEFLLSRNWCCGNGCRNCPYGWKNVGMRAVFGTPVVGVGVGPRTECAHYHSELDVIAIRFKCCDTYYPCYECHEAVAGHAAEVWPRDEFEEKAILCGACGFLLTVSQYMGCGSRCPECDAEFNPGCAGHYHLYFEM